MAIRFLTSQNIQAGTLTVSTIANLATASNVFLVSDGGLVKYRTAAQVRSDIGAGTGSGSVTSVAVTNGTGISASVANATTTPNITITNTDLGSSQAIFKNFAVSGQSTVVADSNNDTLTLVAGSNITITTNATTDTITIASNVNNNYPTSLGWDTATGILTLGRNGLSSLTVDLDGRYPENNGTGATGTWPISITGNAATATALQTTRSISLGTAVTSTATNFNGSSNITIPITGVSEAYLNWGGRNLSGSYAPIDAALMPDLGANRLAFTAASAVIVEYSQDGGTTWLNYAVPDSTKINLLNGNSSSIQVGGGGYPAGTNYTNYLVRLTINTSGQIYTTLNKFIVLVSTNGSSGSYCTIDARTQTNYLAGNNTWTTFSNQTPVAGWSGYNVINTSGLTTFGNTPATQYGQVRFTFGQTGYSTTYTGLLILKILGFGGVGWQTPSTLAASGNIYTYDYLKNVSFPATVSAVTFSGALSGNSTTATTLQTARNINGTSFNGSANITTANWGTARTITIGNTGKSVNGSGNVSWTLAEIGAQATLTNPVTGTGTTNYVPKFTGSTSLGNSQIYDNGTNVGIGITSPTSRVHSLTSAAGPVSYDFRCAVFGYNTATSTVYPNSVGVAGRVLTSDGRAIYGDATTGGGWGGYFDGKGYFSGNVGIGTTTPTYRLDITGNDNIFRLKDATGNTVVDINGDAGSPATLLKFGDLDGAADNVKFTINTTQGNFLFENGYVGIGTTVPIAPLHVHSNAVLGGTSGNYSLMTNTSINGGAGGNVVSVQEYALRDGAGTSWTTWRYHNSIDVDTAFDVPTVDTKVWWERDPNSDIQSWGNNASTYMTINAGKVGIGTTSPSHPLDVNGIAMLRSALYMTAGGALSVPAWFFQINGSGDLVVDEAISTQNFIFSNSGQVLIGTTVGGTPAYGSAPQFVTASATGGVIDIRSLNTNIVANSLLGRIQFTGKDDGTVGYTSAAIEAVSAGTTSSGSNGGGILKFMTSTIGYSTNPLPRMWISHLGYVTIGSTNSNSHPLRVTTQVSNISIYADYDIVAYSDQSVKENIRPIENVIERVQKSRGVLYDRIDSGSKDNIGFIAQELEVAFPELVVTNEDGTKAVKYQNAVAVMFEAIKEQQKQIDELKELVTKLIK